MTPLVAIALLPLAVLGLNGYSSQHSAPSPQDIKERESAIGTGFTTTVVPISDLPASPWADCDGGWHHWSSHIHKSTSTVTITITASSDFASFSTSNQLSAASSSVVQSIAVSSIESIRIATPSTAPLPSVKTSSSSFLSSAFVPSTSSWAAEAATPIMGPYSNITGNVTKATERVRYFGMNVVNQKPYNPADRGPADPWKTPEDWQTAFASLKMKFPLMNTIRMYSTTDGNVTHLMNAMPAAQDHDLMIVAGVWSGGVTNGAAERFEAEKNALRDVIAQHGCDNIAAISVGNEDLNSVNVVNPTETEAWKDATKNITAYTLIDQIWQVRNLTRSLGCCKVPISHTDTWNEFSNTSKPWIPDLLHAIDQAAIVNIFPYWSESSVDNALIELSTQYNLSHDSIKPYGKDVWLGETGWPRSQPNNMEPFNPYGTNKSCAQAYFDAVGCPILSGRPGYSYGFYYVDWDEDAPKNGNPAFGLLNYQGQPLLDISTCSAAQIHKILS